MTMSVTVILIRTHTCDLCSNQLCKLVCQLTLSCRLWIWGVGIGLFNELSPQLTLVTVKTVAFVQLFYLCLWIWHRRFHSVLLTVVQCYCYIYDLWGIFVFSDRECICNKKRWRRRRRNKVKHVTLVTDYLKTINTEVQTCFRNLGKFHTCRGHFLHLSRIVIISYSEARTF